MTSQNQPAVLRRFAYDELGILLDPTAETTPSVVPSAERPSSLRGKTVALLDISKPRGEVFLNHLESRLRAEGIDSVRFKKPTFAKPAPAQMIAEIVDSADLVIEALAD